MIMMRLPSRVSPRQTRDYSEAPKPPVEDIQLKKAIELLRENKPLQLQKAA